MTKEQEELMSKMRSLFKAPVQCEIATVKEVDEINLSCVVVLANGTEIPDVRLKASIEDMHDGLVQIPETDSSVVVGLIGNDPGTRFIMLFSNVVKVVFFNGENGGLIKIAALVDKVNVIENKVNDIITKFNAHVHSGVTTGPGSSGTTPTTVSGTLSNTSVSELENQNVLH